MYMYDSEGFCGHELDEHDCEGGDGGKEGEEELLIDVDDARELQTDVHVVRHADRNQ